MIPTNEQETIALFSQFAEELGYKFKRMGTSCPDAILQQNGQEIRVEFEYKALNFQRHKHPVSAVDLIICWEDDWPSSPLPVLSLENYMMIAKPMPRWKRLLLKWKEFRLTRIEYRATVKKAKMKLKRTSYCRACGTIMKASCTHEWIDDPDLGIENTIKKECPDCHFCEIEGHYSSMV